MPCSRTWHGRSHVHSLEEGGEEICEPGHIARPVSVSPEIPLGMTFGGSRINRIAWRGNNHPILRPAMPGNREELLPDFSLMVRNPGKERRLRKSPGIFPEIWVRLPSFRYQKCEGRCLDGLSSENSKLVNDPAVKIKSRQWGNMRLGSCRPSEDLSNSCHLCQLMGFCPKEYPRQRVNITGGMQALVTYQHARDLHPRAIRQVGGVFKKAPNKTPPHDV